MKRMSAICILTFVLSAWPSIDFYGYRTEQSYNTYHDSLIHYSQTLLGYTDLEKSEITIIPSGTYLDITEDAWISSDVTKLNLNGLTGDYLFKGTIPVPAGATVVGLQTWKGDTLYRARLYESKYIYDSKFVDSSSLRKSLDSRIALLQQHTDVIFELTLTRIALGEKKHVRIRYLLRSKSQNLNTYNIPVLLHTIYGKKPDNLKVTVYADKDRHNFLLNTDSSRLVLSDTCANLIPYQPSVNIQFAKNDSSTINMSEFTSGPYRGNYLSVNTAVKNSIVSQLSKPISTVFVWRWCNPQSMIEFQNQLKTLSGYAYSIISQAQQIKQTMLELNKLGNSFGLIHLIEGQSGYSYCSKVLNIKEDSTILAYLDSFNEIDMYKKYADNSFGSNPSWIPVISSSSVIEQSRNELVTTLTKAKSLFNFKISPQFHHIVILTNGNAPAENMKNMSEELKTITDSLTIAAINVQWRGVDINNSFPTYNLYQWRGFLFPSFSPVLVQLRIKSADQNYSFALNQNVWSLQFSTIARSSAPWDTTLYWIGLDGAGKQTATIEEHPIVFSTHADSALAKIWASDEDHIAESEEIYPGGTFGILTKATYLQATINSIAENDSRTIPYLGDEEIFASRTPVTNKAKLTIKPVICFRDGILDIKIETKYTKLKIFDLNGRQLLCLELSRYRTADGHFKIPLSMILAGKGRGKLLVVLTGKDIDRYTLIIGGAR
jgi:hypothetical protein